MVNLTKKWSARRAAVTGSLLLDQLTPGWREHADADSLNMLSDYECAAGQAVASAGLEGGWHAIYGLARAAGHTFGEGRRRWAARHGFVSYDDGNWIDHWIELHDAWAGIIRASQNH